MPHATRCGRGGAARGVPPTQQEDSGIPQGEHTTAARRQAMTRWTDVILVAVMLDLKGKGSVLHGNWFSRSTPSQKERIVNKLMNHLQLDQSERPKTSKNIEMVCYTSCHYAYVCAHERILHVGPE